MNIIKTRAVPLFPKIDLCSTISIESSRRDLLNDMAEHRSILKTNNKYVLSPGFITQIKQKPLKQVFRFDWVVSMRLRDDRLG